MLGKLLQTTHSKQPFEANKPVLQEWYERDLLHAGALMSGCS